MPTPGKNESHKDFIDRCMGFGDLQDRDPAQRRAICESMWREAKAKTSSSQVTGKLGDRSTG